MDALIKPIQEIKSKDVWITTHDRVYDWWVKKNKLRFNSKLVDEKNYLVEIENNGEEQIDDVMISLTKKSFSDLSTLKVTLDGRNLDYISESNSQKIKVAVPTIHSKETKRLNISFLKF